MENGTPVLFCKNIYCKTAVKICRRSHHRRSVKISGTADRQLIGSPQDVRREEKSQTARTHQLPELQDLLFFPAIYGAMPRTAIPQAPIKITPSFSCLKLFPSPLGSGDGNRIRGDNGFFCKSDLLPLLFSVLSEVFPPVSSPVILKQMMEIFIFYFVASRNSVVNPGSYSLDLS